MSNAADEVRKSKAHEALVSKAREALEAGRLNEIVTKTGLTRATVHACAAGARMKILSIVRLAMFFDEEDARNG